jgi:N-acetylmuramoyl-L-alanine amidase
MIKYKLATLFMFIMMLCTVEFVSAQELVLKGKTIYIDPGHGGRDPGTIYKDTKESDINLEIAMELKQELEKQGAKVYLTRIGDYDLSKIDTNNHKKSDLLERAKLINESECDIYISIHLNSDTTETWSGAQTFYTNNNKQNKILATIIQNKLKETTKTTRKIKELKNMYLFDRIKKTGVLIEAGFLSNANDRYLLKNKEYQKRLAQTITEGLIEYYK